MKKYIEQKFKRTADGWVFEKEGLVKTMEEHHAKELNDQFEQNGVILAPIDVDGKILVKELAESMYEEVPAAIAEKEYVSTWDKIKSHFKVKK